MMARIACSALLLVFSFIGTLAAADDPVLEMYKDALLKLKRDPANSTVLASVRPTIHPRDPAHAEAMNQLVDHLASQTEKRPSEFHVVHNYYLALWLRYLEFGSREDAASAFAQLDKAAALARPGSIERARCAFEQAQDLLALRKEHAEDFAKGDVVDAAIERFINAKRVAMSEGYYAARCALALADLYIQKGDKENARKAAREAIDLDRAHGCITNHAYDRLGLILVAEGNLDGATAMLEAGGKVRIDDDMRSYGYAHNLAWALIQARRHAEPVAYLEKAIRLADEGKWLLVPEAVYALATGYTEQGQADKALIYWKKYLDMADPDEARRQKAKETAQELAIKSSPSGG